MLSLQTGGAVTGQGSGAQFVLAHSEHTACHWLSYSVWAGTLMGARVPTLPGQVGQ